MPFGYCDLPALIGLILMFAPSRRSGCFPKLLRLLLREHDDGGMDIERVRELLDALLADTHSLVLQKTNVDGSSRVRARDNEQSVYATGTVRYKQPST